MINIQVKETFCIYIILYAYWIKSIQTTLVWIDFSVSININLQITKKRVSKNQFFLII